MVQAEQRLRTRTTGRTTGITTNPFRDSPGGKASKIVAGRITDPTGKVTAGSHALPFYLICDSVWVVAAKAQEVLPPLNAQPPVMPAPIQMERHQHAVTFGAVTGHKYVYLQTKPSPWKQVDYLLEVEKGFVSIRLCAMGDDFDEQELEDQLATLKLA